MYVLLYPPVLRSRPLGSLSLSGDLVHPVADEDWYVVTQLRDRRQEVHGRLDVLHAQVLMLQSLAVAEGLEPLQHH